MVNPPLRIISEDLTFMEVFRVCLISFPSLGLWYGGPTSYFLVFHIVGCIWADLILGLDLIGMAAPKRYFISPFFSL